MIVTWVPRCDVFGGRIGKLIGLAHNKPIKCKLALQPEVPGAGHGRKGQLLRVRRQRGQGEFSFPALDFELKLHITHARGLKFVPDKAQVIFHNPVFGKPVRAGQNHRFFPAFQTRDGVDPEGKAVFWKRRADAALYLLPDG